MRQHLRERGESNVDAEIRTAVVENALVIPREALRHDAARHAQVTAVINRLEEANLTGASLEADRRILERLVAEGEEGMAWLRESLALLLRCGRHRRRTTR